MKNVKDTRFRRKYDTLLNKDVYESFIEKFPEHKSLTIREFKNIIQSFNRSIANAFIENRNGIELPNKLGFLFIGSCEPPKQSSINHIASAKANQLILYKNWETDNLLMKIFYTNHTRQVFRNGYLWSFRATREVRKRASRYYVENWQKFPLIASKQKVSHLFMQTGNTHKSDSLKMVIPQDYDEFKM